MWRGVFAVVYTYNRKELVAQCLASILDQRVGPEHIVLVDNGCTDGTRDYLAAAGVLADPRIDYMRLVHNTGAAGGLRAGISRAYARGCDWVWIMDDDVVCRPDTLQRLKEAFETNFDDPAKVGFLVSRLVGPQGLANNVPQVDDRRDVVSQCADWSEFLDRGLVKLRIATMTSMLLPRSTLAEFGAPRSDFFIWGEDTDYTLRITQRLPGFLVGGSLAVHLRGTPGDLNILNEAEPRRIRNFYYLYRNTAYLRRAYWPRHGFYLFLGKAASQFLGALLKREHRLLRAWTILSGTWAGLFFRPRNEPLGFGEPVPLSPAKAGEEVAVGPNFAPLH
jgi:dTDP-4-dehydrorhamnose reductase